MRTLPAPRNFWTWLSLRLAPTHISPDLLPCSESLEDLWSPLPCAVQGLVGVTVTVMRQTSPQTPPSLLESLSWPCGPLQMRFTFKALEGIPRPLAWPSLELGLGNHAGPMELGLGWGQHQESSLEFVPCRPELWGRTAPKAGPTPSVLPLFQTSLHTSPSSFSHPYFSPRP